MMTVIIDYSMGAAQHSLQPSAHTVTAFVYTLLLAFGVDVSKGLFAGPLHSLPKEQLGAMEFLVHQRDGKSKLMRLDEMCEDAQDYFYVVQSHLIFRLHTQRGGYFYHEILAMMLDPVFSDFAVMVLGAAYDPTKEWIDALVNKYAPKFAAPPSPVERKRQRICKVGQVVVPTPPESRERIVSELEKFITDGPGKDILDTHIGERPRVVDLHSLLHLVKVYDPLRFWANSNMKSAYPAIYLLNLTLLAYQHSTALVESMFSLAGKFMRGEKNNHSEELAKAILINKTNLFTQKSQRKYEKGTLDPDEDSDDEFEAALQFTKDDENDLMKAFQDGENVSVVEAQLRLDELREKYLGEIEVEIRATNRITFNEVAAAKAMYEALKGMCKEEEEARAEDE